MLGPRSPSFQVGDNRATDVGGKREAIESPALACHGELADAPVEVVEPETRHLARPKPESQEDRQHGVVTASDVSAEVAGVEQCSGIGVTDPHR